MKSYSSFLCPKELFLNKVTLQGIGGWDFSVSYLEDAVDPSRIPWSEGPQNTLWEMPPEPLDPRILSTSHHMTCRARRAGGRGPGQLGPQARLYHTVAICGLGQGMPPVGTYFYYL